MSFNSKNLYFKALSLSLASMMTFFSAANATYFESANNKMSSVSNVATEKMEKLKEWSKKHWILTGSLVNTAIGAGTLAVGIPSLIGLATAWSKSKTYDIAAMQSEEFKTTPNIYTKKQEGLMWCWIACLQGMYKYHDIEISQEDIFKKIFKVAPAYFEVIRINPIAIGGVASNSFVSSVNSINSKLKYNKAIIHVSTRKSCKSSFENIPENLHLIKNAILVKNAILDYYNSINKEPFAILDSYTGTLSYNSEKYMSHVVNVINIDDEHDEITIEDPATGLSRVEKLNAFVTGYYASYMLDKIPVVEMFSVAPSNLNLPVETHYFVNEDNYTKQSC